MKNYWVSVCLLTFSVLFGAAAPAQSADSKGAVPASEAANAEQKWPYRIVVVPDTQRYTIDRIYASDPRKEGDTREKLNVAERNQIFEQMMQWVADNRDGLNIKLLLHVGDLVEKANNKSQYAMIEKGIAKLDGEVPYVLAVGNHDSEKLASEFFPVSRNPLNVKMLGGQRTRGNIGDLYATLTINGQKYLVMTMSYHGLGRNPDKEKLKGRLAWADKVFKDHGDHKVIFLTHYLLTDSKQEGGEPPIAPPGRFLFDNLLTRQPNLYMTFCGHVYDKSGDGVATGYRKDKGNAGNTIHSTLFNSQWIDTNGGDGWLRVIEFHKDGRVVHRSYSPYLDQWNKGPGFEFEIPAEGAAR